MFESCSPKKTFASCHLLVQHRNKCSRRCTPGLGNIYAFYLHEKGRKARRFYISALGNSLTGLLFRCSGLLLESAYSAIDHNLLLLWVMVETSKGKDRDGARNVLFIRSFDQTEWVKCKTVVNRSSLIKSSLKPSPPQMSNSNFFSNFSEILYSKFIAQL